MKATSTYSYECLSFLQARQLSKDAQLTRYGDHVLEHGVRVALCWVSDIRVIQ